MTQLEQYYNERFAVLPGNPKFEDLKPWAKRLIDQSVGFHLWKMDHAVRSFKETLWLEFCKLFKRD